ncbi:MAG: malonyl CoA-acyl carrier protein transacylase [Firmicutes bacterium]|nr:malonyl CoA-acyl carrier protein transacylase [Bacillota bacterium]
MIACLFAGQGSQYVGMGSKMAAESVAARLVYEEAASVAGTDLLSLDEAMLSQTRYAQLAIVTLSLASYAALQAEGVLAGPVAYAGFSLGEYSAIGAAGILSTTDVLRLVEERSRLMQQASEINPGAMYAILGLDDAVIESILAKDAYHNQVFPVNYNCPGQLVIAGSTAEAAAAADELKAAGAKRALKLNVSGAFHTRFMAPAAAGLSEFASRLTFAEPKGLVFSNRSGQALPASINWPDYLADHLCNAVRWTNEVQAISQAGAKAYIEIGPGKTLSGLIKKIIAGAAIANVEDPDSLAAAVVLLKG